MVAKINAIKPNHFEILGTIVVASRAPTIVIPDIAFDPDIRGVCSVGGTFVITSKPIKTANINIVKVAIISKSNAP